MGDSLKVFITVTRCREKHAPPLRVVNCAIYSTLTRFTKFRVSNLHITSTQDTANTLHLRIFQGRLSRDITYPSEKTSGEDSSRVLTWGLHGQGNSSPAVVIIPPLPPNVTRSRDKPQQTPIGGKACSSTKGGLLRYILYTYSLHKVSSF